MTPAVRLIPDDAPAYVALRREMLGDSPWAFTASAADDRGLDEAGMRASLALPAGYAVVGVREGARLVAAAGVIRLAPAKRRHLALVWGVYVTPGARGRGLGRAVVGAAVDAARSWDGVDVVQLAVNERSAAARRLYESMGFVAWGTEPDAVRIGDESTAETHMVLALGPRG